MANVYAGYNLNVYLSINKKIGKKVDVLRKESGAPYLDGCDKCFSLSHKEKTLCYALSDAPVGVDIEKIVDKPSIYKIADRYFGEVVEEGDAKAFYTAWTRKEALGKLLEVGVNKEILAKDLSSGECKTDLGDVKFFSWEKDGFLVTVATLDESADIEYIVFNKRPSPKREVKKAD